MAKVPIFKMQDDFADAENRFSYPTTCQGYTIWGDDTNKVHLIRGTGAPGTDYNNAPNGSEYTDMTNLVKYIKTAAATWTKLASNT